MPPLDDQTGDRAEQEPERLQAEEGPGESRRPHQGQGDGPPQVHARQRLVARGKSQEILPVLPRGHRKRHKRGKSYAGAGRGRIPGRIDIDLRPKSVENRARAGHCEGGLINGLRGTGNLVTVVERMSRFTLVGYSATKETDAVMAVFKALLRDLPREMVQSLTLDNGKEYAKCKVLVRDFGLDVFFAKPYLHTAVRMRIFRLGNSRQNIINNRLWLFPTRIVAGYHHFIRTVYGCRTH